jgi:hypothetical protein
MFVGCKLPHGHTIDHLGEIIVLNGANVGYDAANPWRNDAFPDAIERASGSGLTLLTGDKEAAFKDWYELNKSGGPIAAGAIFVTEKEADVKKEAKGREKVKTGVDPLDPANDLPKGLETAKED